MNILQNKLMNCKIIWKKKTTYTYLIIYDLNMEILSNQNLCDCFRVKEDQNKIKYLTFSVKLFPLQIKCIH